MIVAIKFGVKFKLMLVIELIVIEFYVVDLTKVKYNHCALLNVNNFLYY